MWVRTLPSPTQSCNYYSLHLKNLKYSFLLPTGLINTHVLQISYFTTASEKIMTTLYLHRVYHTAVACLDTRSSFFFLISRGKREKICCLERIVLL